MESRKINKDCSFDLFPHTDSGLFGNKEESSSAESEDQSEMEASSDASSGDAVPETEQQH